jgi:homogentisate 1,2-dioxygenase
MRKWIAFPRSEGCASRQAHADVPPNAYERELGRDGFYGPSTQMLHRHPPTGWSHFEGPLRPRAFDTTRLKGASASPWDAWPLLGNAHLNLRLWRSRSGMDHLARNGDGDELIFVHEGRGHLFCDYGHLAFRDGDFIVLPRGTMWRVEIEEPLAALPIEATNDSYQLPEKGIVGAHAVFDPAALDTPEIDAVFRAQQAENAWRVAIKRRGVFSTQTFPFNPLDALGWHGTLAPVRFNWRDLRPVMSHRMHLPPSVHTTFVAERFVVCAFVPRPLESDPGALKLPFFHNNDDYDEMIFYHRGTFTSRDDIRPGMITLHPSGFTHGPHPKALEAARTGARSATDEVAVMIDARDALDVAPDAGRIEWAEYVNSWKGGSP